MIKSWLQNWNKPARLQQVALLVLVGAIFPFLFLAIYCHPSADDFWLTNIAIAKGSWTAQWEIRQTWSGRYFAMFLAAFNPLVYHSFTGYKTIPVIIIILLGGSIFYFISQVFRQQITRLEQVLFTLVLLGLYLGFMPVVSQTIYWLSGIISYQLANIGLFFLGGLLIDFLRNKNFTLLKYILSLICVFTITGLNETSMAFLIYLLFTGVGIYIYQYRRLPKSLLGLLFFAGICSYFVLSAPGNALRSAEYPAARQVLFSLSYAGAVTVNNSFNWLTQTPILFLTILFIPFAGKLKPAPIFTKIHPVFIWLLFLGGIGTCFFVSYFSKGNHAPPRVQDAIYLFFITGWFQSWLVTLQYLAFKKPGWLVAIPPKFARMVLLIGLLLLFLSERSHIREAYLDIFSGRAARYDKEMEERYIYLTTSPCKICKIPAVKNIPKTIFFEEIPADTTWKNRYFSQYFNKELMLMQP